MLFCIKSYIIDLGLINAAVRIPAWGIATRISFSKSIKGFWHSDPVSGYMLNGDRF